MLYPSAKPDFAGYLHAVKEAYGEPHYFLITIVNIGKKLGWMADKEVHSYYLSTMPVKKGVRTAQLNRVDHTKFGIHPGTFLCTGCEIFDYFRHAEELGKVKLGEMRSFDDMRIKFNMV